MERSRFIIGIDLGTTNSALAFVDTKGRERVPADLQRFAVPQLIAPAETATRAMLPSFLYLPGGPELPPGATRLPWAPDASRIVGEFAQSQGAKVPSRLVASAKSWLCHGGVDREAEILPWGAPAEVPKVSPVEASCDYLRHLRDGWNWSIAKGEESLRLERQEIILTVPASFDEAARELTVEAAKRAGFERLVLLEEPQAAFYCWIATHKESWQSQLRAGELILVCDIGGGTTDFSLITVVETPDGPGFRRVAVGDHLMLGGDNMDLALAHKVEAKLSGASLDHEQWSGLRHACRIAKEKLLDNQNPAARWPVTVAGRGSKLIGGGLQSELTREEVAEVVLEGFFPFTSSSEEPAKGAKIGLQEFGLPFVSDPAIPKHLAQFLRRHQVWPTGAEVAAQSAERPARPDAILFNGGALTPAIVRDRLVSVLRSWYADGTDSTYQPRVLSNDSLELAVSIGAAYYGVVRRGGGIRIGGGTARSYYVGIDRGEDGQGQRTWLCVVPRESQEGDEIEIQGQDFDLLMGQPVALPLASSSVRPQDRPGDLVSPDPDSILELPPLVTVLRVGRKAKAERVRVGLEARVTEVGTIELRCRSRTDDRHWRLQIQLRGPARESRNVPEILLPGEEAGGVVEQSYLDAANDAIREAFTSADPHAENGAARLVRRLETIFEEPRDRWPLSALRSLWEPLRDLAESRVKTPRHESRWFNLAGFCLRPGAGFPLDEARIKALWPVFHGGVKHQKDLQCWAEWWILWRRVSAGLNRAHQEEIHRRLVPFLLARKGGSGKKASRPKPEAHELAEMWRCVASLERLPASLKEPLGDALLSELKRPGSKLHVYWCLGRLGARTLLYGPANTVVPPGTAARWVESLLTQSFESDRERAEGIFALAQLARISGDRARDLDETLRTRVIVRLEAIGADADTIHSIRAFQPRRVAEQSQALGDALPVGLRLLTESTEAP